MNIIKKETFGLLEKLIIDMDMKLRNGWLEQEKLKCLMVYIRATISKRNVICFVLNILMGVKNENL